MENFVKPVKKLDTELYSLINEKIASDEYVFLKHAKQRQKDRLISDLDVIHILEGTKGSKRRRNKSKDKYEDGHHDWNYCIEGYDINQQKIRVVISFNQDFLLVITVIRINKEV